MNKYKEFLDRLLSQLETFKFTSNKVIQLLNDDEVQLNNGGEYLNKSAIFIRDWNNFSDKDWLIDYQRIAVYSKVEYLKELDEIKSTIYKHYLIEVYEALVKFIAPFIGFKECQNLNVENIIKEIDLNFQLKLNPFGFNNVTFLYMFCKARNSFTHNDSIMEEKKITACEKYIKDRFKNNIDINQQKCNIFSKAFFNIDIDKNNPKVRITVTKEIFNQFIGFTQSYAFSLYKYYSEKEGLAWEIKNEQERLDIKTNKPLTEDQKEYHASIAEHLLKKYR